MDRLSFFKSVCFYLAVGLVFLLSWKVLLPCLAPFLVGWLAAACLRPGARWLRQVTRMAWRPSAVAALLFFWLGTGLLLWWLGSTAFFQGAALLEQLPELYQNSLAPRLAQFSQEAQHFLGRLGPGAGQQLQLASGGVGAVLQELLSAGSAQLLGAMGALVKRLPAIAVACSFTVLSSFFILMDYDGIRCFLLRQLPSRLARPVRDCRRFLLTTVRQVAKAYFLIMLITFGEISVGLWLLGVDYYLILGLTVAVLDILPVLGSGSVLIPWGLWSLVTGRAPLGVGILVLYGVVTVVRTIVEPKILGAKIGLNPLATILAMYVGLKLGGFTGLILAPMAATLLLHLNDSGHLRLFR